MNKSNLKLSKTLFLISFLFLSFYKGYSQNLTLEEKLTAHSWVKYKLIDKNNKVIEKTSEIMISYSEDGICRMETTYKPTRLNPEMKIANSNWKLNKNRTCILIGLGDNYNEDLIIFLENEILITRNKLGFIAYYKKYE